MNAETGKTILINGLEDFGASMLIILGSVILIMVGFLIVKRGWKALIDNSLEIGGYYVGSLPYKGYKRFRSKKWNMEHMQ